MAKIPENPEPGVKLSPIRHNDRGEEVLDTFKRAPPVGFKKTESIHERLLQSVRLAKLEMLRDNAPETEEEADDFEIGEDFEPMSKYENDHMPTLQNLKKRAKEINDKIEAAKRRAAIAAHEKALKERGLLKDEKPVVNPGADPSPEPGAA